MLKFSSPYISSLLCHIYNKIFSSGIFPERLKYAVIKPVFKSGDRSDVSTIDPYLFYLHILRFSKVLCVRRYQYLINNNIVDNEQFGFRTKTSTMEATFNLINEISNAFN